MTQQRQLLLRPFGHPCQPLPRVQPPRPLPLSRMGMCPTIPCPLPLMGPRLSAIPRPSDLFGHYIRNSLAVLFNPTRSSLPSLPLACIAHELVAAGRDTTGNFHVQCTKHASGLPSTIPSMYEVVRCLTIIFPFCVLMGDLTVEGRSVGSPSGHGDVWDPRDPEPGSLGRHGVDGVHDDIGGDLASPPPLGF